MSEKTGKMSKRWSKSQRKRTGKFSILDIIVCVGAVMLLIGAGYYFFHRREQEIVIKSGQKKRNDDPKSENNVIIKDKVKKDDGGNKKEDGRIKSKTKVTTADSDDKVKENEKEIDEADKDSNNLKSDTADKDTKSNKDPKNGNNFKSDGAENDTKNDKDDKVENKQTPEPTNTPASDNYGNFSGQIEVNEEELIPEDDSESFDSFGNGDDNANHLITPVKENKSGESLEILGNERTENSKLETVATNRIILEKDMLEYGELPPLLLVIKNDTVQVFQKAIEGANLNLKNEISGNGFNALHYAASLLRFDIMRFIIENELLSIDEAIKDGQYAGNTVLHLACLAAEAYPDIAVEAVQFLLKNGANINALDENGFSPIFCAIQSGHLNLVELLLSKDANMINIRTTDDDSTLLHYAMGPCSRPIVKLLIEKDAEMMHAINSFNREPIHEAAVTGCVDGLKELILTRRISKQKPSPSKAENKCKEEYKEYCLFGAAPLHFATKFEQLNAVEFLFLIQSKFYAQDEDGKSAQYYAEQFTSKEVKDYFCERIKWENKRIIIQDVETFVRLSDTLPPENQKKSYKNLRFYHLHKSE